MPIQLLAPEVVDQIAAGEVVERPAHLVKELVENAIDAGATEVEVDFDQGGRWVKVRDNGVGIPAVELPLALARHATSKISLSSDIWGVRSYGFRGEALATIGAVSRLSLVSRPATQELAASLVDEFGLISEVKEQGAELGTTVTVAELFANVPARLKFLKSEAAETSQIKSVLKAMAMANPEVAFRIRHKGKLLHFWPQSDRKCRVEQVLEVETLYGGESSEPGVNVEVFLSSPHHTERSSRQIWIFVQRRWVQDRSVMAAVMEAYRNLLMHGEYPVAAVWVDCPPEDVDVNIHPAKSAVKFQNSSLIFRAVSRTARAVLEQAPWLEGLRPANPPEPHPIAASPPRENLAFNEPSLARTQYAKKEGQSAPVKVMETLRQYAPPKPVQALENDLDQALASEAQPTWGRLQVLGQANLTYILTQSDKALVLVDQHAAHERVAFERLMAAWKGGWIDVQQYLLPLSVQLEADAAEGVLAMQGELARLGLHISAGEGATIHVQAAPALLSEEAVAEAVTRVGREYADCGGSFALEKIVADLCATMACHSVVRAGQALGMEQMQSLLRQMDEFPLSSFCPHGRPVHVEMTWSRLEREFGRIL